MKKDNHRERNTKDLDRTIFSFCFENRFFQIEGLPYPHNKDIETLVYLGKDKIHFDITFGSIIFCLVF